MADRSTVVLEATAEQLVEATADPLRLPPTLVFVDDADVMRAAFAEK